MTEEGSSLGLMFKRPEMAYAVNIIIDIINTLHSIKSPNRAKIRNITNGLMQIAMIIYNDEQHLIEFQQQLEEASAQSQGDKKVYRLLH
jgi:hypothetical protein